MLAVERWLFVVTDPLTRKRRRTTYRLTVEQAQERYVNPGPIPDSLVRREVNEQHLGHVQTSGAPTKASVGSTSSLSELNVKPASIEHVYFRYTACFGQLLNREFRFQRG